MGKLYVVGVGNGNYEEMTIKANNILLSSDLIYCDDHLFQKLKDHYAIEKLCSNSYNATFERCVNAINSASILERVSVLGTGDTGVYGISSIVNEQAAIYDNVEIEIIPGVTSAISGAALLGAPLTHDFVIISLSDNLADGDTIKKRLIAAIETGLVIVFYSPCNPTYKNLLAVKELLMQHGRSENIVGIASNIGEEKQFVEIIQLKDLTEKKVTSYSTIVVGNENTYLTRKLKMVTPLY